MYTPYLDVIMLIDRALNIVFMFKFYLLSFLSFLFACVCTMDINFPRCAAYLSLPLPLTSTQTSHTPSASRPGSRNASS